MQPSSRLLKQNHVMIQNLSQNLSQILPYAWTAMHASSLSVALIIPEKSLPGFDTIGIPWSISQTFESRAAWHLDIGRSGEPLRGYVCQAGWSSCCLAEYPACILVSFRQPAGRSPILSQSFCQLELFKRVLTLCCSSFTKPLFRYMIPRYSHWQVRCSAVLSTSSPSDLC